MVAGTGVGGDILLIRRRGSSLKLNVCYSRRCSGGRRGGGGGGGGGMVLKYGGPKQRVLDTFSCFCFRFCACFSFIIGLNCTLGNVVLSCSLFKASNAIFK